MAKRRMTSREICASVLFLDMTTAAQALYHLLILEADDEGVVEAETARRMMKLRRKSMQELINHQYLIPLDDKCRIAWIRHWDEMNSIKSDRFHESRYHEQVEKLRSIYDLPVRNHVRIKTEKSSDTASSGQSNGTISDPQYSPGKESTGKTSSCVVTDPAPMNDPGVSNAQSAEKILYTLGKEQLTEKDYLALAALYGSQSVEAVISRILQTPYYGRLNVETISRWCKEASMKKSRSSKARNKRWGFEQHDYDFDQLEKELLEKPVHNDEA